MKNNTQKDTLTTKIDTPTLPETKRKLRRGQDGLTTGKPLYLYDFNGRLVGRFRGPTDAAKKLLSYDGENADIHDARKLSILRTELSLYAKSNCAPKAGITYVQGYVPSYEELTPKDITESPRNSPVRGNKVLQYDYSGNLVQVFENAADAAEKLGKSTAWVSILCNADFILRYDR